MLRGLESLPMDSMAPTTWNSSIGAPRSTVPARVSPRGKDADPAEWAVGSSSKPKDAFASEPQDNAKTEIDGLGLCKTEREMLVGSGDGRRDRGFDGDFGSSHSTFSPQAESEGPSRFNFRTPATHSSPKLSTFQSSEPSSPPTSSSSAPAVSSVLTSGRDSQIPGSPYTQQRGIFLPPYSYSSDFQTSGPSLGPSSSVSPASITKHGNSQRDSSRSSLLAAQHSESFPLPPSSSPFEMAAPHEASSRPASPSPKPSTLGAGVGAPGDVHRDSRRSSSSAVPRLESLPLPPSSSPRGTIAVHGASSRRDRGGSSPAGSSPKRSTLRPSITPSAGVADHRESQRDSRKSSSSVAPRETAAPMAASSRRELSPASPSPKPSTLGAGVGAPGNVHRDNCRPSSSGAPRKTLAVPGASPPQDRGASSPAAPSPKRPTQQVFTTSVRPPAMHRVSSQQDRNTPSITAQSSEPSRFSMLLGREASTVPTRLGMGFSGDAYSDEDKSQSNQLSGRGWSPSFTNTLGLSSALPPGGSGIPAVQTHGISSRAATPPSGK